MDPISSSFGHMPVMTATATTTTTIVRMTMMSVTTMTTTTLTKTAMSTPTITMTNTGVEIRREILLRHEREKGLAVKADPRAGLIDP